MKNLYRVALSMLPNIGHRQVQELYNILDGDISLLFHPDSWRELPNLPSAIVEELRSGRALQRAEQELAYVEKEHLRIFFRDDPDYPPRLKACPDAPLLMYLRGTVNLNPGKVLAVVGTRKLTSLGRCYCEDLVAELARSCPGLLIVSGLAYGADVCAHRAALANGLPTLAVVAHGQDSVYPAAHRSVLKEMLTAGGGMLSEFPHGTEAFKSNFVQRNRIVAGLSDACVVIESPEKGGSLITARMARDYDREVFTFPGRPVDENSRGCNKLIKQQIACLIESAEDLLRELNWDAASKPLCLQTQLFANLSEKETALLSLMEAGKKYEAQDLLGLCLVRGESCARHIGDVLSILLMLEMNQAVIALPGGLYQRRQSR